MVEPDVSGTLKKKSHTWLDHSELQQNDPNLLEYHESSSTPDSIELSSLPDEENDEDMVSVHPMRRNDHVYQCRRRQAATIWISPESYVFSWSIYFRFAIVFISLQ